MLSNRGMSGAEIMMNVILRVVFNLIVSLLAFRSAKSCGRNKFGWAFLCFIFPPLIVLIWQMSQKELNGSIPKRSGWIIRIVSILGVMSVCLLIGNLIDNSILLSKLEAQLVSLICPVRHVLSKGQVLLFNKDFTMAMPGGLLNGAMATCAVGAALGGLIFKNQPFSMLKVMGMGAVIGLITKLFKDIIFVLLVWIYSITAAHYAEIISPLTIFINSIIIYVFAFKITGTGNRPMERSGPVK